MKKINISIKDETHVKAKVISALKQTTMSEYLERAVEEAIKKDKAIIEKMNDVGIK